MTRLEGHESVKTIKDYITRCNPKLGVPDAEVCGTVVTNEVDPNAFVADALFALHMPMATTPDDVAILSDSNFGVVFDKWQTTTRLAKNNRIVASKASDTGRLFYIGKQFLL